MTLPFSPQQLLELQQNDPAKYWEFVTKLAALVTPDEAEANRRQALRDLARSGVTLEAFRAYYELIHAGPMVPHNEIAAEECFAGKAAGEIFLYIGFRGCRKTTTFDITLGSFLHGHCPEQTGVVTGANDPNAKLIAKSIAQIIEYHPEFRAVFPYVEIDKDKGWGAEGYWIRDGRKTREEWTAQQAKVNDPSFVGGGYKSSEINGKHPSLYLIVDDLHDIDSSASPAERETIKNTFLTQILPTVVREGGKLLTWIVMTGVPFAKDDTYAVLRESGGTRFFNLPVMRRAPEGEGVYLDGMNQKTGKVYDDIVGWWYLTWPENFNVETIMFWRAKSKRTFWQMFMLDINTAKTAGLVYYLYPHDKIPFNLPTGGGADPTQIDPDYEVGGKKRSSFALAYVCKLTDGRLVLKGGVLKQMGIVKAKEAILQAQTMFLNWITTAVENVGPGKIFMQYLRLDSKVRFRDSNIANPKGIVKDKMLRFEDEVAPWLESGVLLISDEENDYCTAVRYLCDNFFDIDARKPNEALDAGDGLYHALKLFPEALRIPVTESLSPTRMNARGSLYHPLAGGT